MNGVWQLAGVGSGWAQQRGGLGRWDQSVSVMWRGAGSQVTVAAMRWYVANLVSCGWQLLCQVGSLCMVMQRVRVGVAEGLVERAGSEGDSVGFGAMSSVDSRTLLLCAFTMRQAYCTMQLCICV